MTPTVEKIYNTRAGGMRGAIRRSILEWRFRHFSRALLNLSANLLFLPHAENNRFQGPVLPLLLSSPGLRIPPGGRADFHVFFENATLPLRHLPKLKQEGAICLVFFFRSRDFCTLNGSVCTQINFDVASKQLTYLQWVEKRLPNHHFAPCC